MPNPAELCSTHSCQAQRCREVFTSALKSIITQTCVISCERQGRLIVSQHSYTGPIFSL